MQARRAGRCETARLGLLLLLLLRGRAVLPNISFSLSLLLVGAAICGVRGAWPMVSPHGSCGKVKHNVVGRPGFAAEAAEEAAGEAAERWPPRSQDEKKRRENRMWRLDGSGVFAW